MGQLVESFSWKKDLTVCAAHGVKGTSRRRRTSLTGHVLTHLKLRSKTEVWTKERDLTCQKSNIVHILLAHREPIRRRSPMNEFLYLTVFRGICDFYERLSLFSQYSL